MARQAEDGDAVAVHYTGSLDDGTVFDSSREGEPIQFEVGSGQVIPGFEAAVRGLEVGESVETRLEPEEAYGPRRDDLVMEVERSNLPDDLDPDVGEALAVQVEEGQEATAYVTEVGEEAVTLDLNHPLAGRTLHFEVELVEID